MRWSWHSSLILIFCCLLHTSQGTSTNDMSSCVSNVIKKCTSSNPLLQSDIIYYAWHDPRVTENGKKVVKIGYWTPKTGDTQFNIIGDRYGQEQTIVVSQCLEELKFARIKPDLSGYDIDKDLTTSGKKARLDDCVKSKFAFLGAIICNSGGSCMDTRFNCAIKLKPEYGITPVESILVPLQGFQFAFTPMRYRIPYLRGGTTEFFIYDNDASIADVLKAVFSSDLSADVVVDKKSGATGRVTAPGLKCRRYGEHDGEQWIPGKYKDEDIGISIRKEKVDGGKSRRARASASTSATTISTIPQTKMALSPKHTSGFPRQPMLSPFNFPYTPHSGIIPYKPYTPMSHYPQKTIHDQVMQPFYPIPQHQPMISAPKALTGSVKSKMEIEQRGSEKLTSPSVTDTKGTREPKNHLLTKVIQSHHRKAEYGREGKEKKQKTTAPSVTSLEQQLGTQPKKLVKENPGESVINALNSGFNGDKRNERDGDTGGSLGGFSTTAKFHQVFSGVASRDIPNYIELAPQSHKLDDKGCLPKTSFGPGTLSPLDV